MVLHRPPRSMFIYGVDFNNYNPLYHLYVDCLFFMYIFIIIKYAAYTSTGVRVLVRQSRLCFGRHM